MALAITITDGTTTLTLTDNSAYAVLAYAPKTPAVTVAEANYQTVRDGGEIPVAARRNITESLEVLIMGSTVATLQVNIQAIEKMIRQAEQYQRNKTPAAVYLTIVPDGTSDTWRSEILTGKLNLGEASLHSGWWNRKIEAQLTITRRWFWEANSETELGLKNGTVADYTTGGVTITNHDDSDTGHCNWVEIGSSGTTGTMPAPFRLELTNATTSTGYSIPNWWVGTRSFTPTGTTWTPIFEAENSTVAGTATTGALATCSNGNFAAASDSTVTTWGTYYGWSLSSDVIAGFGGQWYVPILRFGADLTTSYNVRLLLALAGSTSFATYTGQTVTVSAPSVTATRCYALPPMQMPEYKYATMTDTRTLFLQRQKVSATTTTGFHLDYVAFLPTDAFRYTTVNSALSGYAVTTGETLKLDEMSGELYAVSTGGINYNYNQVAIGNPLVIWPGRTQQIYALWNRSNEAQGKATAKVYYRPRKLTL